MTKCWLCEAECKEGYPTIFGLQCPECGPPEPMGPTPEELREDPDEVNAKAGFSGRSA